MAAINVNKWIDDSAFKGLQWTVFLSALIVLSFDGYDFNIYGASVPLLMRQWGLNPARIGVIGSYVHFGGIIGAIVFGVLADKIGRKASLIFCTLLYSAATGLTGLAPTPGAFGFWRFIAGLGLGGALPNSVALMSEYAPLRLRAFMIATIFAGFQFGGIAGALLSMRLFPLFGWRSVYYLGALPLILVPIFMLWMPESAFFYHAKNKIEQLKKVLHRARPELAMGSDATFEVNKAGKGSFVDLFRESRATSTIAIWVIYLMCMYMIFGLGVWIPKLMMNAGFPLQLSLWFSFSYYLGALIFILIGGKCADKFGTRPILYTYFVIAFLAIVSLAFTRDFYLICLLVAVAGGTTSGGINVAISYCAAFYPPQIRASGQGFAYGVGRFGGVLGPAITGFLMTLQFSLFGNLFSMAIPALVALLALLFVQDRYAYSFVGVRAPQAAARLSTG